MDGTPEIELPLLSMPRPGESRRGPRASYAPSMLLVSRRPTALRAKIGYERASEDAKEVADRHNNDRMARRVWGRASPSVSS